MNLLSTENSKLGTKIASWSISRDSCIGRTEYCARYCYGKRGHFVYSKIIQGLEARYAASNNDSFADDMIAEINNKGYKTVRVHAVGDFYSSEYVRKWILIAANCRNTTFYAYTRAWQHPIIKPWLDTLNKLPNFILYASTDKYTGNAPDGWFEANMSEDNAKGYHECVSKCHHCSYCYTAKGNVFFRTRKGGRHAAR